MSNWLDKKLNYAIYLYLHKESVEPYSKFSMTSGKSQRRVSATRFPTVADTLIFDYFCLLASAAVYFIFSGLLASCLGMPWISSDGIDPNTNACHKPTRDFF